MKRFILITVALAALTLAPGVSASVRSTHWCGTLFAPGTGNRNYRLQVKNLTCANGHALAIRTYYTGRAPRGYSCASPLFCWTHGHVHWFHSYLITAPPPPPPPSPPPPPPAQPGHYKGMTSQNEDFEFDVTSDGMAVTGLITGQINESCTPAALGLYGGNLRFGSYTVPVASDGSFKIDVTYMGSVSGGGNTDPTTNHLTITGHFSGALVAGTLLETTQFTDQGTAYSCSSNPQTWNATKTS